MQLTEKQYDLTTHDKTKPLSPRGFQQATVTLCLWQKIFLLSIVILLIVWAFFDWRRELLIINSILTVFYLLTTLYRMLIIELALSKPREMHFTKEDISRPPNGKQWPKYMVILPMFREGDILPHLIDGMKKLDYPQDRLEIRLLIEEDDDETMSVAKSMNLRAPFKIVPIPKSYPRTKPKACNVGIEDGDADYLVIYDAEDRVSPDQLKKAAHAFAKAPDNVACIQAKLGYYNSTYNLLTKCFTAEYATWFGLCLPGLDCLAAPIPLGGTSNHFKLDILRKLGGWDEYNVTEDCDLGLRLFRQGYRTRILESDTLEQACPSLPYWIKQRSRWVKGYIQTYCIHTRDILSFHKSVGFLNSLQFHLLIGGTFVSQLINPFYWLMTLLWLIAKPTGLNQFFPLPVFIMGTLCLCVGNFIFLYTSAIACVRRGVGNIAKYTLLMPFYWMLMSLAAWKGFLQLFSNPHHWEKTKHFAVDTNK